MKPLSTNASRSLALLISPFLLSACGGGGGGGAPAATAAPAPVVSTPQPQPQPVPDPVPQPDPLPQPDPVPQPVPESSRLADNPLPSGASFDNFASDRVVIPVSDAGLVGDQWFVKVSRADGQTLFLGAVSREGDFTLPVHVPLDDDKVLYEIFSDSSADQIVFGEVSL